MLDNATYTPRLKTLYKDTIRGALKEEFGYKNDMQLPKLEKNRSEHRLWPRCCQRQQKKPSRLRLT